MLRARDILKITVPAALLAFAVQPLLDPGPAPAAESVGAVARAAETALAPQPPAATRSADETSPAPAVRPKPRVGCEGAISALAGQEARRLLPSRCLV